MNVFETLREQVPIGRLVELARGDKVRCVAPGHPDNSPSMHLYDDHVHCFACGFHGDVVDVWAAQKGFGRPIDAAVDLAREFCVELPEADPEARRKAQERREKEGLYLDQARACHRALSRHAGVAGDEDDEAMLLLLGAVEPHGRGDRPVPRSCSVCSHDDREDPA